MDPHTMNEWVSLRQHEERRRKFMWNFGRMVDCLLVLWWSCVSIMHAQTKKGKSKGMTTINGHINTHWLSSENEFFQINMQICT
jgi:hypothetical protein